MIHGPWHGKTPGRISGTTFLSMEGFERDVKCQDDFTNQQKTSAGGKTIGRT